MIDYDPGLSSYGRALTIGVLNTLKVSLTGVVAATLLGTLIAIARLWKAWLVARLAAAYVEVVRNVPLLLQLLFWYALLQALPPPRQAWMPFPGFFLSNRGLRTPALEWTNALNWCGLASCLGACAVLLLLRFAKRRQDLTGSRPTQWRLAFGLIALPPVVVWVWLGERLIVDWPVLKGFNFTGGALLSPECAALTLGLVVYTSAYIAEIVRSGISAIAPSQWEAATALGLRWEQALRLIVLPQAVRVVVPPLTSQYLHLVKNSSLAVAIGYPEVVSIASTTMNQTGQAIEAIGYVMLVYLSISLSISLLMNWYEARITPVLR